MNLLEKTKDCACILQKRERYVLLSYLSKELHNILALVFYLQTRTGKYYSVANQ